MNILQSIYRLFRSFGLATVLLIFLTLVTLLGTLDQVYLGLFGAVQKYFHSWFIKSDILHDTSFPVPIFLPGGMLLMFLLFINMSLGAVVHLKKRWRGLPALVTHFGMLFLFISGYVTFLAKNDGYVALFPGQSTNRINSYKTWQLEILEFNDEKKAVRSHVIPWEQLASIGKGQREFTSAQLPFTLEIDRFMLNSMRMPATSLGANAADGVEAGGVKLVTMKKDLEEEKNFPGCLVRIFKSGEQTPVTEKVIAAYSATFLPGESPMAAGFEVDGKTYGLSLTKTSWEMPYQIRLDRFIFEKHPGTEKPRNYESRITRVETPGTEGEKVSVRMNEPMRHGGFVVFQERYGQSMNGQYYSQFAVSDNPSDQWPTWALLVISLGLLLQFVWKLVEYLKRSRAKGSASLREKSEKEREEELIGKKVELA